MRAGRLPGGRGGGLYAAFFPVWFFLTIYLQQVEGYDAIRAGASFLPMTLTIFAASSLAPRVVARFGARTVISTGMAICTAGMVVLTGVAPGGSYAGPVLAGQVLTSLGMGMSLVPATIIAMQGLPRSQSGLGSGLLNTARLMGGALGLAVLSTIATGHTVADTGVSAARALTDGFDLAFGVGAGITGAAALAAALLLRRPRQSGWSSRPARPWSRVRWRWRPPRRSTWTPSRWRREEVERRGAASGAPRSPDPAPRAG